jgi:hypothetical protein
MSKKENVIKLVALNLALVMLLGVVPLGLVTSANQPYFSIFLTQNNLDWGRPTVGQSGMQSMAVPAGQPIRIHATPNNLFVFERWEVLSGWVPDLDVNVGHQWITMPSNDVSLMAVFMPAQNQQVFINAIASPANGGIAAGGGVYNRNTTVMLQAVPNSGWAFDGWFDNNIRVSTSATWSFTATANRVLEARFTAAASWSLDLGSMVFPSAMAGYGVQAARSVTIYNTGAATLSWVSASITSGSASFEVTAAPLSSIAAGGQSTVSVRPRAGLSTGTHSGMLTVTTANGGSQAVSLVFTVVAEPVAGLPFGSYSPWAREELTRALENELIPLSLMGPNVNLRLPITRAEFAGIAVQTYENMARAIVAPASSNPFIDTWDIDALRAFNAGIMVGTAPDRFSPDNTLTRQEAATALTRVYKKWHFQNWTLETDANFPLHFQHPPLFADDAAISSWARNSVYFMYANGIIQGLGNNMFGPRAVTPEEVARGYARATREQAIVIALRMIESENLGLN